MITEINLKTGKKETREWSEEEIDSHNKALEADKKANIKVEILSQLEALDLKSIRALREGDAARIKALEDEAKELRKKLK